MSITPQQFSAFQQDDKTLVFTASSYGDITGQLFAFHCVDSDGYLVFRLTSGGGSITITTAGSASTYAVVEVDLTDRLDEAEGVYGFQLDRTSPTDDTVAAGAFELKRTFRTAVPAPV